MKVSTLTDRVLLITFLIVIYHMLSSFSSPLILPPVAVILSSLKTILTSGDFFQTVGITLFRTVIALIIAIPIGATTGIVLGLIPRVHKLFRPLFQSLQSTPVISWLLLALLWFEATNVPILVIILSTLPIIVINVSEGTMRVDPKLIEMAEVYKVPKNRIIRRIYLPSVFGYLLSSIRIAGGLAFKVAVMAEVLANTGKGIGEKMNWARINIETANLIAWTVVVIVMSVLTDRVLLAVFDRKVGR